MLIRMEKMAWFSVVILIGALPAASVHASDYLYFNCSDQRVGLPLVECPKLVIKSGLNEVVAGDTGEVFERVVSDDYMAIGGGYIPIAVPRKGYSGKKVWSFDGRFYVKAGYPLRSPLDGSSVDVVCVVKAASYSGQDSCEGSDFSFWYSVHRGVVAIGLKDAGDSGSVFFCAESSGCLFPNSRLDE